MKVIQLINRLARVPDRDVEVLMVDSNGKTQEIDSIEIKGTTVVLLQSKTMLNNKEN